MAKIKFEEVSANPSAFTVTVTMYCALGCFSRSDFRKSVVNLNPVDEPIWKVSNKIHFLLIFISISILKHIFSHHVF
jgi:hypothetical protein